MSTSRQAHTSQPHGLDPAGPCARMFYLSEVQPCNVFSCAVKTTMKVILIAKITSGVSHCDYGACMVMSDTGSFPACLVVRDEGMMYCTYECDMFGVHYV